MTAMVDALVLLPGMMCDDRLWRHQVAALSPLLHKPIQVAPLTGRDSVAGLAAQVLAQAPERFALAGLSMGGIVAFEIWRQAPARVQRLALLDTNHQADAPERRQLREQQLQAVAAGELESVLREDMKPQYLAHCHRDNKALLDEVLAMGLDLGSDVFVSQTKALRDRPDSSDTLATIDCPTLILCGAEDGLCPPAWHEHMAQQLPYAELVILPDSGHLPTLEQPDAVNHALYGWLTAT